MARDVRCVLIRHNLVDVGEMPECTECRPLVERPPRRLGWSPLNRAPPHFPVISAVTSPGLGNFHMVSRFFILAAVSAQIVVSQSYAFPIGTQQGAVTPRSILGKRTTFKTCEADFQIVFCLKRQYCPLLSYQILLSIVNLVRLMVAEMVRWSIGISRCSFALPAFAKASAASFPGVCAGT